MAEAIRMLERGDATADDIDIAMKLGAGKLTTLDFVWSNSFSGYREW